MFLLAAMAAPSAARAQTKPAADPATSLKDPAVAPSEREEAARRLLAAGTPEARNALVAALSDVSNRKSQLATSRALAGQANPDPAFIIPLFALLGPDPQLTSAAAVALSNYRDNDDVRRRLTDIAQRGTPEAARLAAIGALGKMSNKPAATVLMDLLTANAEPPAIHRAAAAALVDMTGLVDNGRNAALWQQWWDLNRTKDDVAFQNEMLAQRAARLPLAEQHIARLRDELQTLLTENYQSAEPARREPMLLKYLSAGEPEIRSIGARLVMDDFRQGRPVPPAVKEQLRLMVDDSSPDVRMSVARALADINYSAAFDALLARLAIEKEDAVRAALVDAIVPIHDLRAVDPLLKLLRDPSPAVAEVAAGGLRELAPLIREKDPAQAKKVADELRAVLEEQGNNQMNADLRAALVDAMAPLHVMELHTTFRPLLRTSEPPAVRKAALRALGALDNPATADIIAESLEDPDPAIRLEAVGALQTTARFDQAEKLYARLKPEVEPDPQVRQRAWTVMLGIFPLGTPDALARWADRFKDDPERRLLVLQSLMAKLVEAKDLGQLAIVRQNIAEMLIKLHRDADAVAYLDAAIDYYRPRPESQGVMEGLLGSKTDALLASKQYNKAATFAAESIAADPKNQPTMGSRIRMKAESLNKDGKLDEAKELIDAVNKMSPRLAEPYLGQIKNVEGDVRKKLGTK